MMKYTIAGNIADIINERIFPGEIEIDNGKILSITENNNVYSNYILPGFIDSHIHIESSMLVPSEFAKIAARHGTLALVSDPHEIANVMGIDGVKYMIYNAAGLPIKFYFGVPSCVPATDFETAGASIDAGEIEKLFKIYGLSYLSEMMNFPGVIYQIPDVMKKIEIAKKYNAPIDGHAPGLSGENLRKYAKAGISTDHECFDINEAREKISLGMKILIREGSAAKNFEALFPLIDEFPEMVMLCSDDKHPDDLIGGHINKLVSLSVNKGLNLFNVLKAAILNPIKHYKVDIGLLRENDSADFIIVDNLNDFNVIKSYKSGEIIAENGRENFLGKNIEIINNFKADLCTVEDLQISYKNKQLRIIQAIEGELITKEIIDHPNSENGYVISDLQKDYLKIVVLNRYQYSKPAVALINGFEIKNGAIATSVAHDSHNIIAVGADDESIISAINSVIINKGGMAICDDSGTSILKLPIAGIMSNESGESVAEKYAELNKRAKNLGTNMNAPFMTLSFMALLVIPEIKLSDKGLFDGRSFEFLELEV